MIRHMVLIRPADDTPLEKLEEVLAQASEMSEIPGVVEISFTRNLGLPESSHGKGVTHVLTILLADIAALERFRPDPLHRNFGQKLLPLTGDLTIIDLAA